MKVGERTGEQYKLLTYFRYYTDDFIYVSVEHYRRCGYRCLYCITESQGKTMPAIHDPNEFRQQLDLELEAFAADKYMFCVSGATDPYNDIEAEYGYTRYLVDQLTASNRRFSITTKSPLVLRDLDLLKRLGMSERQKYILTISASRQDLLKDIEPFAPPPEERINAVHKMHEAGLPAHVLVAPWIPGITDTDRLLSLLPKGIGIAFQPLDLGHAFQETLDQKRPRFSADLSFGSALTQDEINRAYIQECNTIGRKYWNDFQMEWRLPITSETHQDNSGYLKKMRPGRFDPDQWVDEHPVKMLARSGTA